MRCSSSTNFTTADVPSTDRPTQYHLHDLRHAGLTLGAQSGATIRELMARAGHSTSAAAMKYQHAAEERGKLVAAGMNIAMEGLSKQA